MIRKYNRMSVKRLLAAFVITAAFWSPRTAAQEALPGNVIESLKNAATVSRQPNDVLALVVITVIANYPRLLDPVIAKALELAPQERYALAEQVVASFPGYTNRILAATNIYKPQPIRYARPPAPSPPRPQAAQEHRYAPIPAPGALKMKPGIFCSPSSIWRENWTWIRKKPCAAPIPSSSGAFVTLKPPSPPNLGRPRTFPWVKWKVYGFKRSNRKIMIETGGGASHF